MKRKTISMLLACAMMLSLAACGNTQKPSTSSASNAGGTSGTTSDPEFTLIVGSTIQDDSASGIALIEYFKPYVEENSNGRIRVDVQNLSLIHIYILNTELNDYLEKNK